MSPETPNRPWQRVAADLFELEGNTYLVISDYYSHFFELDHLRSPSLVCHQKVKGPLCAPRYSQAALRHAIS